MREVECVVASYAQMRDSLESAIDSAMVAEFYEWVSSSHEQAEHQLTLLRAQRNLLFQQLSVRNECPSSEAWLNVNALIGWAEERHAMFDGYAYEITSLDKETLDLDHPGAASLWLRFLASKVILRD